jgi:FAD/FMN-containing dehydrogenase
MEAALIYADRLRHAVGGGHVEEYEERVVVHPGAPGEIADVLRIAREVGASLGVGAARGICLDLSRMRNLLHLDETSLLVSVQAGISLRVLEELLTERGLTLGPLPPPSEERTVGALLAAPRPSEAAPRRGRFIHSCVAVAALLPDGTEVQTRIAPRKATGPDLMHALIGARGTLGLITAATLRVERRQETRLEAAFHMSAFAAALGAARALLVAGGRPIDLQVTSSGMFWVQIEAPDALAHAERGLAERIARAHDGEPVPANPPPRYRERPYERALALEQLADEAGAPSLTGDALRVVGWHVAGATLIDLARPPAPAPEAPPLLRALKRRLDPDARLPAWPGAH